MKKFVTLFTDSFRELKAVRTITTMAMLAAVAVILGFSPLNMGSLFGLVFPVFQMVSLIICLDRWLEEFSWCVGYYQVYDEANRTILSTADAGCYPGRNPVWMLFYKKKLTIWRVLAAKFVVMLVCNVILTTLCLNVLYGQAFMVLLPARALKNLIMWPIDSVIFFAITKALEQIGLFRMFQKPVLANSANMQGN